MTDILKNLKRLVFRPPAEVPSSRPGKYQAPKQTPAMPELPSKPWWKSKGMWGGLLTAALPFILQVASMAGIDVSFLNDGLGWNDVPFILTGILSIVGRIKAKTKIGK